MTTFVTAFLSGMNGRQDRGVSAYLSHGRELMGCSIPLIVFMDETIEFQSTETIRIIPITKESMELYTYKNDILNSVITDNPLKDTIDYRLLICSKTEFVRKAIELNPFHTDQFVWIDFGIQHVCSDKSLFRESVQSSFHTSFDQVRIGNIWNTNLHFVNKEDIYNHIAWYFAGGVFGGSKSKLLEFDSLVKQKCIQIIQEKHTLMWEVNVWYLVFTEHPELFSLYSCNHNLSLITNY